MEEKKDELKNSPENIEKEKLEKKSEGDGDSGSHGIYRHTDGLKIVLVVIGVVVVVGGAFAFARIVLGTHKGERVAFGYGREVKGGRSFGAMRGGMMGGGTMYGSYNENDNARLAGQISAIADNDLTIKVNDKSYTVVVDADTSLTKSGEIAKQSDLQVNDNVLVRGSSKSDGSVVATQIIIK